MKIVFMGTPEFSVGILEALALKYEVALVVSRPDKERNRKKELIPTPVKKKALELGIKVFQPEKIKTEYQEVLAVNADVLVTAAYGQMIPDIVLKSFKHCLNVHGSILPKHRGGAPIQRSIINGDTHTGVTIVEMVKKMDAGEIYATKEIEILDTDNTTSLFQKLSVLGKDLLMETIEDIYNGKLKGVSQQEELVTFSPNLSKEEEHVDFNKNSLEIFNQIRGLAMEPGAYATINGEIIKIYTSQIVEYKGLEAPGTILSIKKELLVKTKDKALRLLTIKPSGKKIMIAKDYLNGQKLFKQGDILR